MKNLPTKQELLEVAKPMIVNLEVAKTIDKKSQTRRVIKLSTSYKLNGQGVDSGGTFGKNRGYVGIFEKSDNFEFVEAQWKVGNILWVREPVKVKKFNITKIDFEYLLDGEIVNDFQYPANFYRRKWIEDCQGVPSGCIKEMARTFLRVTNVRIERLNDMTLEDVIKEGCQYQVDLTKEESKKKIVDVDTADYKKKIVEEHIARWWILHWNKTAPKGYKWEDNPWVFVYEFEKVEYQK